MTHEIRNPMNAIVGMNELILKENLTPGAREQAEVIKDASTQLLRIVNNILIYSKLDSNKWEDTEIFRFYRTTGSVGELYVRDFQAKVSDTKADRGICFTAGVYTEEGRKYAEGRPIDLIQKDGLIKLLKKVDSI